MTLRLRADIPNLRKKALFEAVLPAIGESAFGLFFRVVEFSVQQTHLHFIVEAADSPSLRSGVKALSVRLASRINARLGRTGRVFADRYHLHVIESPREARAALVCVLGNARKHAAEAGVVVPAGWIDPLSSAPWFRGWCDANPKYLRVDTKPVATARTWLLTTGLKRYGRPISVRGEPARKKAKKLKKASA